MILVLRNCAVTCVIAACQFGIAQQLGSAHHHVDRRNMYERVLVVVPTLGAGTHADPRRPMYAPAPGAINTTSRAGILAFQCIPSDNGLLQLCEFVAKDRAAFKQILADPSIKTFLKDRDKVEDILTEFKKHKKDFSLDNFGVRMP